METRIYPGQPGLTQDSSDEGVDYLRRLKGAVVEGAPADAVARGGGEAPAAANSLAWKEKRRSPRLRCSGSAEFRVEGNDARMWGTVTDVSLHGCYVEMNTTFPVGTKVDLVLKSFGVGSRLRARFAPRTPSWDGHLLRGNPTRTAAAREGSPHQTSWAQRCLLMRYQLRRIV